MGTGHSIKFWVGKLSLLSSLSSFGKDFVRVQEIRRARESTGCLVSSRSLARKLDYEKSEGRAMTF